MRHSRETVSVSARLTNALISLERTHQSLCLIQIPFSLRHVLRRRSPVRHRQSRTGVKVCGMLHRRQVNSTYRGKQYRLTLVADGSEESQKWDEQWLHDHNLPRVLESKAITMKFARDSDEAGYFHAFCHIITVPFLAVV